MQCVYNTVNVPVNDLNHQVQDNDELPLKGKDYDDTNHIKKHQGTEDADYRGNIIEECENGDDFIHQNKKIHVDSGKTVEGKKAGKLDNASKCSESFKYSDDNIPWKSKHRFWSGSKKIRKADKPEPKKKKHFARNMVIYENGILQHVPSVMCHQCQRNDKGRVVECQKCTTKRYCVPCMTTWYPNMTECMFAECCPFCLCNCNCTQCLRDACRWVKKKIDFRTNNDQKVECSMNILQTILPFLKRLNEERLREMEIEAAIKTIVGKCP